MLIQRSVTPQDVDRFLVKLARDLGNRRPSEWTGLVIPRRDNKVEVGLSPRADNLRAMERLPVLSPDAKRALDELKKPRDESTLTVLVAAPSGWVVMRHPLTLVRL